MPPINPDRDDIDFDDSRDAIFQRAIDRIARHTLDALGYDPGSDELGIPPSGIPTVREIRRVVYDCKGGPTLAIGVLQDLLWPGWNQDVHRPQPPPNIEDWIVKRACAISGATQEARQDQEAR